MRVVQPAAVPTTPSSTGLPITLALGLLAGLAVGVGGALARNALDISVKSPDQLREIADAPNLGNIAYDAQVTKRPLTVHEDAQSPRAEAFRQLRTNLRFVDVDNPRKVILVTSSLPGEGKTTTVVNLAIALAQAETRVLVIEADLRRPKVADLLGLERNVGLTSVLSGRIHVGQGIQRWGGGFFDVLTSGPLPPNPSELLGSRHMADDAPATCVTCTTWCWSTRRRCSRSPMRPRWRRRLTGRSSSAGTRRPPRTQVETAVSALRAVSAPVLGTVFTMVPSSGPRAYAQYNSYYRTEKPADPVRGGRELRRLGHRSPATDRPRRPRRRLERPGFGQCGAGDRADHDRAARLTGVRLPIRASEAPARNGHSAPRH